MYSSLNIVLWLTIISMVIIGISGFEMLRLPFFLLVIVIVSLKSISYLKLTNANVLLLIFAVYPLIQFYVLEGKLLPTVQAIVMIFSMFFVSNFITQQKVNEKQLNVIATVITFGMFAFYFNTVKWYARFSGVFSNPNTTAYMAITLLPLILMFSSSKKIKTIAVINVVALTVYTASRGALMALLLGLFTYYIVKIAKFRFLGIWGVALSCLAVSVYALDIAAYFVETFIKSEEIRTGTRLLRMDSNSRGLITSMAYDRFFSSGTEMFGLGYDQAKFNIGEGGAATAGTHNSYLETLIRLGYIGVGFAAFYIVLLTDRMHRIKNVKYRSIIAMQLTIFLSLATNASVFMVLNFYFFYFIILIEIGVLKDKQETILNVKKSIV